MQQGEIVFTAMNRVIFGKPAADAVLAEAERLEAKRIFLLVSGTLNSETDEVDKMVRTLGDRYAGLHDEMPSHSPRDAVIACANKAREAGTDLLVTFGSPVDMHKSLPAGLPIEFVQNAVTKLGDLQSSLMPSGIQIGRAHV